MGRINKFANIYDTEGNLLRHVEDDGKLKPYTIEELEKLVDQLALDKDENGNVKNPRALNNVNQVLFAMYQLHPEKLKELLEKLSNKGTEKTTEEEIHKAMKELTEELKKEEEAKKEPEMEKYVDFEEVKEDKQ